MKAAFQQWGKNNYFISRNVNLIAPETRTSAPVKITRDIKGPVSYTHLDVYKRQAKQILEKQKGLH